MKKRDRIGTLLMAVLLCGVAAVLCTGCATGPRDVFSDFVLERPVKSQEEAPSLRDAMEAAVLFEHPELAGDQGALDAAVLNLYKANVGEIRKIRREAKKARTRVLAVKIIATFARGLLAGG